MNARTLFVAGCLVALGLGACTSKNETPSADTTTVVPADSAVINPAPPDTVAAPDTTAMTPHDSAAGKPAETGKSTSKGSSKSTAGKKTTATPTAPAPSAPTEYHSGPRGGGSTAPRDSGRTYHSGPR